MSHFTTNSKQKPLFGWSDIKAIISYNVHVLYYSDNHLCAGLTITQYYIVFVLQLYYNFIVLYCICIVYIVLYYSDNHLCAGLTITRTSLPLPFQPLTQLHAWWHLLAGGLNFSFFWNISTCLSRTQNNALEVLRPFFATNSSFTSDLSAL